MEARDPRLVKVTVLDERLRHKGPVFHLDRRLVGRFVAQGLVEVFKEPTLKVEEPRPVHTGLPGQGR